METYKTENQCLTVGELKRILEQYPDEACIWVGDGNGLSNEVVKIVPLSAGCDSEHFWDVLLDIREQINPATVYWR